MNPFKIGDRVERTMHNSGNGDIGWKGTVVDIDYKFVGDECPLKIQYDNGSIKKDCGYKYYKHLDGSRNPIEPIPSNLLLLVPA